MIFLHTAQSVAGRIEATLVQQGHQVYLAYPALDQDLPVPIEQIDALVVMGGPMSAQDPSLVGERRIIDRFLTTQKPYLGVCLGAQILNLAYGGNVQPCAEGQVQMGWHAIRPLHPTLEGLNRVYQWHSDWIEPAAAFSLSASDDLNRVQGIMHGTHHGVQFHPEADESVRERWLARASHKLVGPGAHPPQQHRAVGQQEDPTVASWLNGYLSDWTAQTG